jgi:hypothetical protein
MMPRRWILLCAALALGAGAGAAGRAAPPAAEREEADQEARIRELEEAVASLREELRRLQQHGAAPDVAELARRLEVLADELERLRRGEATETEIGKEGKKKEEEAEPAGTRHGLAPSASKVYRVHRGLSFGGYGEALYENFDSRADDGTPSGETDQLDFLRLIIYSGYRFTDRILFNSEIEFEHASTEEEGDVSVEFAYLDFLLDPRASLRAGLLLVPVGFLNELHEPPIFLGSRRPDVERVIIPTTWRETGFGVHGEAGPVEYRAYLTTSLAAEGFTAATGLRGGRQQGSEAMAEDFALSGRLDFTGLPGLLLGGSFFAGDTGQDQPFDGRVTLYDLHGDWRWRGLQMRGLWAHADVDDAEEIGVLTGERVGSEMEGWYAEAGYDVFSHARLGDQELIPFARYERFDTQHEVPLPGPPPTGELDRKSLTAGLVYKPLPQIAIKADYQDFDDEANGAVDQLNVALGYMF